MPWQKVRRADGLHCSYCNQAVDSDASSCPGCGKALAPPGPEPERAEHSDSSPTMAEKPKPRPVTWWCRYCHKQVSPEAKTCPHCGQPDPATDKVPVEAKLQAASHVGGCLMAFGIVLLLVLVLLFVCRCI